MRDSVQFALAGGENEKAQHCVHIIHGSASFCGLNKIRIAATSLELALDAGEDGEILQALCEDMVREIEVFLVLQSAVLGLIDGASG
jgi:HPt (histidine-containing phosphotransfer) domain-containing protein